MNPLMQCPSPVAVFFFFFKCYYWGPHFSNSYMKHKALLWRFCTGGKNKLNQAATLGEESLGQMELGAGEAQANSDWWCYVQILHSHAHRD